MAGQLPAPGLSWALLSSETGKVTPRLSAAEATALQLCIGCNHVGSSGALLSSPGFSLQMLRERRVSILLYLLPLLVIFYAGLGLTNGLSMQPLQTPQILPSPLAPLLQHISSPSHPLQPMFLDGRCLLYRTSSTTRDAVLRTKTFVRFYLLLA